MSQGRGGVKKQKQIDFGGSINLACMSFQFLFGYIVHDRFKELSGNDCLDQKGGRNGKNAMYSLKKDSSNESIISMTKALHGVYNSIKKSKLKYAVFSIYRGGEEESIIEEYVLRLRENPNRDGSVLLEQKEVVSQWIRLGKIFGEFSNRLSNALEEKGIDEKKERFMKVRIIQQQKESMTDESDDDDDDDEPFVPNQGYQPASSIMNNISIFRKGLSMRKFEIGNVQLPFHSISLLAKIPSTL